MPAPVVHASRWQYWCSKQPRAVCGLPEVFHVSPRSRSIARVDLRRWRDHASDRSEVFRLQTKDVTWPGVACVCMQVNETGHAQRLNMLKERPRKWFFREEVDFLSSLAFVVN